MGGIPSIAGSPPAFRAPSASTPARTERPAAAPEISSDQLLLDQARVRRARAEQESLERVARQGSTWGAAAGQTLTGGGLLVKGFRGGIAAPTTAMGKAFGTLSVGFSAYSLGKAALALGQELSSPSGRSCAVVQHALEVAASGLQLGGSIAIASGAAAGPGTLALGAGMLLDAGAAMAACPE